MVIEFETEITLLSGHIQRLVIVVKYIESNLDKTMTASELSDIAFVSRYHFQRIFVAHVGVSAAQYIKLMRFKQASYQLAFRVEMSLLDIAFGCGFENASSLSREFKKILGITPSSFRKAPNWALWHQIVDPLFAPIKSPLNNLRDSNMQRSNIAKSVHIVNFPETHIAVLEHKGAPNRVMETVGQFIKWRKENGPSPKISDTFNILYDDPNNVAPEEYRFDVCAAIQSPLKSNDFGVIEKIIPSGRCAMLRHIGSDNNLGESLHFLYSQWLDEAGESLRDFPCFIKRVTVFPEVPEHEMVINIYLPIK